jgi:hypothetical protein
MKLRIVYPLPPACVFMTIRHVGCSQGKVWGLLIGLLVGICCFHTALMRAASNDAPKPDGLLGNDFVQRSDQPVAPMAPPPIAPGFSGQERVPKA